MYIHTYRHGYKSKFVCEEKNNNKIKFTCVCEGDIEGRCFVLQGVKWNFNFYTFFIIFFGC